MTSETLPTAGRRGVLENDGIPSAERKCLLGIKRRVEAAAAEAG